MNLEDFRCLADVTLLFHQEWYQMQFFPSTHPAALLIPQQQLLSFQIHDHGLLQLI